MSSTRTNSLHVLRPFASITAVLVVAGLAAGPASARQDPGTPIPTAEHVRACPLQRIGTQFVRCDNLTGNGVAAPGWIPRADATAAGNDAPTRIANGARMDAPSRTVRLLTTAGSAADGFAWSSEENFNATVHCATFDAQLAASVTDRFTLSLGSDGTIVTFTESVSAPRSVWTNTTTGASIVVAGHYLQVADRIPGTHDFRRTVTKSVSRYDELQADQVPHHVGQMPIDETKDDTTWKDLTAQHHFADTMLTDPTPCAAIA